MALFFNEKHVVPLRPRDGAVFKKKHVVPLRPRDGAVFKKKHVLPLRPLDGAVFQRKACSAFTAKRWRCVSKKSMLCLYGQEMALLFQKKHVCTFTCHRCDICINKNVTVHLFMT
jgi:hypothetical protein